MAITTPHTDTADYSISISPAVKSILLYLFIGVLAGTIAVTAAFNTANMRLFEECYASAEICAQNP